MREALTPLPRGPEVEAGALMPRRIVEIAAAKGEFTVSWRYRDERLARRCAKLRRQGWLKRVPSRPGEYRYALTAAALRAIAEGMSDEG